MNRKQFARTTGVVLVLFVGTGIAVCTLTGPRSMHSRPRPENPDEALVELMAGNQRYVDSKRVNSTDTNHDTEDRQELIAGQHPFAAILCCSDSRICPKFIFDQRAGQLFEIRNAGNMA